MKVIGYVINSFLFLVIVISSVRLALEFMREKAGPDKDMHFGPLLEEVSDLIAEQTRKIIPLKQVKSLMVTAIICSMLLVYAVSRFIL